MLAEFPNTDLVGRKPDDFSRPFGFRFEVLVAKQSLNAVGGFQDWQVQNDQTVVGVTELLAEEAQIAGEQCHSACRVKVAKNLLLVVPLGSADLNADLAAMNPPALEQFHLIVGNINDREGSSGGLGLRQDFFDNASSGQAEGFLHSFDG